MSLRRFFRARGRALIGLGMLIGGFVPAMAATAPAARTVWDGVYAAEQARNGKILYEQRCASCHGATLGGGGDCAPPLSGKYFLNRWANVGDLFQLTQNTMPAGQGKSLPAQQYLDIISFVLSFNQMPAGAEKLSPDIELMRAIKFEPPRSGTVTRR